MKLATFEKDGQYRLGVVTGEEIADVTDAVPNMIALVSGGDAALERVRQQAAKATKVNLKQVNLAAPFPRPIKNILCLGLNYQAHVAEGINAGTRTSAEPPKYPLWFTKAVTSVCGPYDDIVIEPSLSVQYDWEVELAVVIRKPGRHITKEKAFEHVHSYTVFNDFSVRDIQLRHGPPPQWFKGKSYDRGSPMGPWLVTADELGRPPVVKLACRVNGVVKQEAVTNTMIFDIPTVIADISEVMTLEAGDIISTGTPAGIGLARKPPEFLKAGDVMETEIEGIGLLRNHIVEIK